MAISTYAGIDNVPRQSHPMARASTFRCQPSVESRVSGDHAVDPVGLPHQRVDRAHPGGVGEMIAPIVGIGSFLLTTATLMQTEQLMAASWRSPCWGS